MSRPPANDLYRLSHGETEEIETADGAFMSVGGFSVGEKKLHCYNNKTYRCCVGFAMIPGMMAIHIPFRSSHVFYDGKIAFHCAKEGRKIDAIRGNEKISFIRKKCRETHRDIDRRLAAIIRKW